MIETTDKYRVDKPKKDDGKCKGKTKESQEKRNREEQGNQKEEQQLKQGKEQEKSSEQEKEQDQEQRKEQAAVVTVQGFDTDPLQLLHALTNLAEVVKGNLDIGRFGTSTKLKMEIKLADLTRRTQFERGKYTQDIHLRVYNETNRLDSSQENIDFQVAAWGTVAIDW